MFALLTAEQLLYASPISSCEGAPSLLGMGVKGRTLFYAVVQAEALKLNKPLVVVGTPGRLAELSRLGTLQSHQTTILVLDEVNHQNFI